MRVEHDVVVSNAVTGEGTKSINYVQLPIGSRLNNYSFLILSIERF